MYFQKNSCIFQCNWRNDSMIKLILLGILLAWVFSINEIAFAFTDTSIPKLEAEVQRLKRQGVVPHLRNILDMLSAMDIEKHTQEEVIHALQPLVIENKIPAYIFGDRGEYSYIEGHNILYPTGTNISLRSQPNSDARVIMTLNTKSTDYLKYLGEWKSPKGEKWILAMNLFTAGELGWISDKHATLVPNVRIQELIEQIKSFLYSDSREKFYERWKYVFYGILIFCSLYIVVSLCLNLKFNIENFLKFTFWLAVVMIVCYVGYFLLKFIWKEIILPILTFIGTLIVGILLILSIGGNCGNTSCPFYPQHNCVQCRTCKYS